jgi:hypothetical protein
MVWLMSRAQVEDYAAKHQLTLIQASSRTARGLGKLFKTIMNALVVPREALEVTQPMKNSTLRRTSQRGLPTIMER